MQQPIHALQITSKLFPDNLEIIDPAAGEQHKGDQEAERKPDENRKGSGNQRRRTHVAILGY
jgi:hypothetical protein